MYTSETREALDHAHINYHSANCPIPHMKGKETLTGSNCGSNKQANITQTHKNVSCRSQGLLKLISRLFTRLFLGFNDFTASCLCPVRSIIFVLLRAVLQFWEMYCSIMSFNHALPADILEKIASNFRIPSNFELLDLRPWSTIHRCLLGFRQG